MAIDSLSAIGILKMPDLYTRMSATTKASILGIGLIAIHIISRAAYFGKVPLWEKTTIDELKERSDESEDEFLW